ncbi:MAG: ParB/RepB/Spo0J family partition protein [Oscillospiraceae bacterium]|nr:ParB/RepB/Spo0J family partition protein [Oscillospiraceae bacterium]
MEAARRKPEIQTLDDLFGITPAPAVAVPDGTEFQESVVSMPLSVIRDFKEHPYRVQSDSITQDIVQDIGKTGRIETPAIVRPVSDGYEMISGHRRKLACSLAGLETMPVIVRSMTDDEAVIAMVSANRQREQVLPSEKAFAYKMWMEALNRQGQRTDLTLSPLDTKLDSGELIAREIGESRPQIFRYIRLTELIPQILEFVDNAVLDDKTKPQMAFRPAVELSYLTQEQQRDLLETIESEDRTPSLAQAQLMKELSGKGELDIDRIFGIMREEKPNQKEQFKIPQERISHFFQPGTTKKQIEDTIIKALEYYRYRSRDREHDRERDDVR